MARRGRGEMMAPEREYLAAATAQLAGDSGLLEQPITRCYPLFGSAAIFPVLTWGIFNPMGPTFTVAAAVSVPEDERLLLTHYMLNPFQIDIAVEGVLPGGDDEGRLPDEIPQLLREWFGRNGSPDAPLLGSLPTWVMPSLLDQFTPGLGRDLMFRAAATATPEDIDAATDNYLKHPGDPWGRNDPATFFAAVFAGGMDASYLWPPSARQFDRWWQVVTSEEHWSAEYQNMFVAWDGALGFQAQEGNVGLGAGLDAETVREFLLRCYSPASA